MASDTARAVGAGAGGGGGGASAGSSSSADSYIGSLISLTSKSEIRYEGVLYNINTDESSIGLRQVRSFGTEGRKKDGPQIPASDKVYEYILFRGSDIKDLQVKSSPPVQPTSIHHDPAIIQSQYVHPPSTTSNLQSAGSGNVPETSSHTTQLGLPRSPFQGSLPLYQPGGGLGSWGSAPNPPTANGSGLAMPPMYWQGYYAPSTGLPHLQQPALMRPPPGLPLPHSMQQPLQYPGLNMSLPPGSQTLPDFSPPLFAAGSSTPGLTSTSLPNTPGLTLTSLPNAPGLTSTSLPNAPGLTSGSLSVTPGLASSSVPATQAPTSSLLPSTPGLASSSLSVTLPLSSASTLAHDTSSGLLLNKSTITTVPATVGTALSSVAPLISNFESITTIPPSVPSILSSKSNTVTVPNMAYQSARQPVQPIVGSSSASQVETSAVPLATSGQLLQTAPSTLPSSQSLQTSHMHVDNKTTEAKIKPLLPDPITPPVAEAKEPILPLPKPITQKNGAPPHNHYNNRVHGRGRGNGFSRPVTKFTEEFDFTAMNEKFNKDEVWGYLGKGKDHLKDGELQEDEADEVFEEVEEEALKLEAKRNERAMESAGGQIIEASDGSNPNPISGEEKKPSPEVEVRLFRRGQGPIDVFQSKLGGWDQDRLEVQDILDKYGLKSLYAFDPSSGRSVPIRFNPRNGRSILPYHAGSTVVVDGEPKDSLVKPVTRIIVGVVAITILIVVLFKEPPEWFKSSRFSVGTFPPWILACMVIVFTRLRKRTKDVFKKYGW